MLTRRHPSRGVLFDFPRHLGEKKQTLDFFVELFSETGMTPFFLAQVKTTQAGYTPGGQLKVGISARDMQRLASYPAPAYIVGIDEQNHRGYIVSANGESTAGFSRMCTDHPMTPVVLAGLHREVEAFWASARPALDSAFVDSRWRGK
jgi:hypothetical protein